jgi:hypothetical protein
MKYQSLHSALVDLARDNRAGSNGSPIRRRRRLAPVRCSHAGLEGVRMSRARNAMTRQQRNDLLTWRRVSEAIVAAVNALPGGADAAVMYPAVMPYIDFAGYDSLLRVLVNTGRITRGDDGRYYPAAP